MAGFRTTKYMESILRQWYGKERGAAEMVRYTPETRSISEVLDKVAARVIPPWELKVTQVKDSWLEIAGPENARRCRPAHLNDGVLYIEVFHPAYRLALETPAIKQNLLKRIQEITGAELCQSIKFIAGGRTPMPRR